MRKMFSDKAQDTHVLYDSDRAEMKLIAPNNLVLYFDEDDVDKLLRVIESSDYPSEEVAEYFGDLGLTRGRYAAACLIVNNARALARLVYD